VIAVWVDALPADNGGADLTLVTPGPDGKPACVVHGAMNKVSADGIWRCITTTGTNGRRCDAGALELSREQVPDPICACGVGAQECARHPGLTRTPDQKRAFSRAWDAAYEAGRR
jgi:hypothetical protein